MDIFLFATLNGLCNGMVYFLIAAGLSIVFGLMDIVNLAHGLMYMLGAYAGLTVANTTGNYWLGFLVAILASGMLGLIIERGFLRTLYREQLAQILVCFGLIYIIVNLHQWVFGPYPKTIHELPAILANYFLIGDFQFTYYRLAIIIFGAVLFGLLLWAQQRTKVGAIVRAGMNDPEHVKALGINLMSVNIGAFVLGAALSGIGGYIGLPVIGAVVPSTAEGILFLGISIIIVGGVGSVQGTLTGALLIGLGNSIIRTYLPNMAVFFVPIVLLLTLIFKPYGLFQQK